MTTTTDIRMAWESVADRLDGLGLKLKLHFEEGTGTVPAKEITDALKQLGGAIESTFSSIGAAVGDPAMRDDAMKLAGALGDALADTLTGARQELASAANGLRCQGGHHEHGRGHHDGAAGASGRS